MKATEAMLHAFEMGRLSACDLLKAEMGVLSPPELGPCPCSHKDCRRAYAKAVLEREMERQREEARMRGLWTVEETALFGPVSESGEEP